MAATHRKRIGVRVNDYRREVRAGLSLAARQGFTAVELAVDGGALAPENLSASGRRHVARLVQNTGMAFTAVACELPGGGLADPRTIDASVARVQRVLQLAADMDVRLVSCAIGDVAVGEDASAALVAVAEQAERFGTGCAVRSRGGAPDELRALIAGLACRYVGAALDPADVLGAGHDPIATLGVLGDQLMLAYVRDAIRGTPQHPGGETQLGAGSLDLTAYAAAVSLGGLPSPPILRRTQSANPAAEIAADRETLAAVMG
jgi:sugar phosphate isomerase/epimerase